MSLNLSMPEVTELKPRIIVFGVGGAGGNAVANMIQSNLQGVDFVVANTDAQALSLSPAERRIQMGTNVTQGLGAGSRPEIGRAAAEESLDEIIENLSGSHMAFVTAGMGGGTGTGAAPVIARAARDQGILTVGVVTKPFQFEGDRRLRVAEAGIDELQQYVDTLIIIPNQNLFRIANERTTFAEAFAMADEVLHSGVRGITDLMVMPGLINLDFADVRTVMNEMGKAMMGTGEAEGEKRAIEAAEAAISNPLLDEISMKGARGVIINVTGGMDMTLFEVDEAANRIRSEVDPDANIMVGATFNEALDGCMRISVVATGIDVQANAAQGTVTALPVAGQGETDDHPIVSSSGFTSTPANPISASIENLEARMNATRAPEQTVSVSNSGLDIEFEDKQVGLPDQSHVVAAEAASVETNTQQDQFDTGLARNEFALGAGAVEHGARDPLSVETLAPQTASAELMVPQEVQPKAPPADMSLLERVKRHGASGLIQRVTGGLGSKDTAPVQSGRAPAVERKEPVAPSPAPAPSAPRATEEAPSSPNPDDGLLPSLGEDEQLEIPAFLRRQAN